MIKELAVSSSAQRALMRVMRKAGLISEKNENAYTEGEACPVAFFSRQGLISEIEALGALSKSLGIPQIPLDSGQIANAVHCLENPVLAPIGIEKWRALRALPLEIGEKSILVAMANPLDHEAKSSIEFTLNRSVQVRLASEELILNALVAKANNSALFEFNALGVSNQDSGLSIDGVDLAGREASTYEGDASSAPVIRLVNKIFADAVQLGASDVHISPEKDKLQVKARIDGVMQALLEVPGSARRGVSSRIKLLCGMDIAEHRKPQDGRLRIKTSAGPRDLRISTVPTAHGENIVARILTSEVSHISFGDLGMQSEVESQFKEALEASSRIVLVTGPTGSGKTSSLYSSLLHLSGKGSNIVTIEDPIEYRLSGLTQIQVNSKVGMTFADTLRAVLRQDPDIVMVGEIRDGETASVAMQVAQTGHLVLSTLHANSAAAAVTRLRDLGIPPYLIASSLGAVLAQRLVRKLCSSCSKPVTAVETAELSKYGIPSQHARRAHEGGCELCLGTGCRGRVGVFSLLSIEEPVRAAIRSGANDEELEFRARAGGFRTLHESGFSLISQGLVSLDELLRHLGPPASSTWSVPTPVSGIPKPRILLVEDEENTRTVLSMLLQRERFEVFEATHGLEGLDAVYEHTPALIITDLMMPHMSGQELVAKLKSDPRTRHIPVLVLTAADTEEQEYRLVSGGADDFVSKTTDSKIMLARIHRLLERASVLT
jgi:type II secretory ATPase GspE/PulE/Tfp pilus assembly ATPase PilB-like protein/ActR/RegA family two-component response regulator